MSIMNFQQTFRDVKPPEKGSFPLDHEGEPQFVKLYLPIIYGRRYPDEYYCYSSGAITDEYFFLIRRGVWIK